MSKLRKILVIGGSRGLGAVAGELLHKHGARVAVMSRGQARLPWADLHHACDVTQSLKFIRALREIRTKFGFLDGVLFCARYRGLGNSWQQEIAINLGACRNLLAKAPGMFGSRGGGSVVLIGSTAARGVALEQSDGYHAAKAGLMGLSRYYAYHLARKGIRVNVVSPGTFQKKSWPTSGLNPRLRKIRQTNPFNRLGQDREIAEVCDFLLGPQSSWITGQELVVDGGAGLVCNESMVAMKRTDKRTN